MPYDYNPHRHVKIWLSKNPSVFMNLENQIRLIKMREQNPTDIIHLVYDSSLLNKKAQDELSQFCEQNNLIPIDANALPQQLVTEQERELYKLYQDEIRNLDKGGNLAAASDIIRWLPPVYRLDLSLLRGYNP